MKVSNIVITATLGGMLALTGCSTKKDVNGSGVGYANQTTGANSGAYAQAEGGSVVGMSESVIPMENVIYFGYDQSSIEPTEYNKLNAAVGALTGNMSQRVLLAGHTDERGTREYNAALGERRAMSVKEYLTTNGVSEGQIDTVSYGEERPAAQGNSEAAYSQNRRVEINYAP